MLLIDLSNNNTVRDLTAIKRYGVVGAWLKVSDGLSFIDGTYKYRSILLQKLGIRTGGYHFARCSSFNAEVEAHSFVSALGEVGRRDLRPVLDLEVISPAFNPVLLGNWSRTFCQYVLSHTGVCPIVYSYASFLQAMKLPKPIGCGLWLASYGANDGKEHPYGLPRPWTSAVAHQFTSNGKLLGIDGTVDLTYAPKLRPLLAHPIVGLL